MLYYIFFAIVLDFLYFKLKYYSPRGPPVWYGFPFVGLLPLMMLPKSLFRPLYMYYLRHGPDVLIVRIFGALIVTKGAAAKAMYVNENCSGKPETRVTSYLGYMMSGKYGLVYTDGGKYDWRSHRKTDVAALYALSKREMVVKSGEVVDVFLREIENHEGQVWDCDDELMVSKYQESANVNLGAVFEVEDIKQFTESVAKVAHKILPVALMVTSLPLVILNWVEAFFPNVLQPTLVGRVYRESLRTLIQKRVEAGKDGQTRDFLQATLRVKEPEDAHKHLCASLLFLMQANTHSTHHTILSAMTILATHPSTQKKLYEEVNNVLGDEVLTLDHLDEMHYLRAVVMETNRLDSPFPFNLRLCTAPTTICGYQVPGQVPVLIPTHGENWDPVNFPQPLTFRPERFLDESGKYRRDPNLGVFGTGKRECPGKVINMTTTCVFICKILQHYKLQCADNTLQFEASMGEVFPGPFKAPFRFVRRNKNVALPTTQPSTELSTIFKKVLESV